MMSSKNNGFKASDIERYHSGKMLPEERHALEKAALDDPFLADALEGYAFTSSAVDDLSKIQSRINEKTNRKKVVPFYRKYRWLSAAAIIIVVIGAGWFAYTISKTNNNSITVAKKENTLQKDSSQNATAHQNNLLDSTLIKDKLVDALPETKRDGPEVLDEIKSSLNSSVQSQVQTKKEKETTNTGKTIIPRVVVTSAAKDHVAANNNIDNLPRSNASRMNEVSLEPKASIISNQTVKSATKKEIANNAPVSGSVRGITVDTIKNLDIVMQPLPADSSALQEVVIGYGVKKQSANTFPHVVFDTLEPAEGYVNFDSYVANNLKVPDELKAKMNTGEVELSFNVDKNGQPVDITVVKSLCQKCDEEAIRLLKEGPKWNKKKNKKGKITIRF